MHTSDRPRTWVLPPAPYALALLLGWWLDRKHWPLKLDDGTVTTLLGWFWVVAGIALAAWALWVFYRHKTTPNPYGAASALCTDGPFRFSRNPIYLADMLILVGVSLLMNTLWPLLFLPLVWAVLHYGVIRHEEAWLTEKFGAAYRDYTARVRRWL